MGIIETIKMQERREGKLEGRNEERAKAFHEKLDIARKLKKEGLSVEFIAKTTKLRKEEIEKL